MWSSLICRPCVLHWGQWSLSLLLHIHVTDLALRASAVCLSNSQVSVIPSLRIAPSKVSRKSHLLASRWSAAFRKGKRGMRLLLYVIRKHRHYAKHFRQYRCRHRGEQQPGPWAASGGTLTVLRRRAASWKSSHIKWLAAHNPSNTPSVNTSHYCELSSCAT